MSCEFVSYKYEALSTRYEDLVYVLGLGLGLGFDLQPTLALPAEGNFLSNFKVLILVYWFSFYFWFYFWFCMIIPENLAERIMIKSEKLITNLSGICWWFLSVDLILILLLFLKRFRESEFRKIL